MENKGLNTILIPNSSEKTEIKKQVEFDLYCLWLSIPQLLKRPPQQKNGYNPTAREFAEGMGIDDEQILDLVELKNKSEFAERYNVSRDTLTDWAVLAREKGLTGIPMMRNWIQGMTQNLIATLYSHAMKKGNPLTMKLWFQVMENWKESATIDHTFTPISNINHEQYDQSATDILEKNS